MSNNKQPRICAVSMARNDDFFIEKWISYYGAQLGQENLYLVLDGQGQPLKEEYGKINVIRVPHIDLGRSKGDRNRAGLVSRMAGALFTRYDIVIAHDIDEILVVDPNTGGSLAEYLARPVKRTSLSALGLDVGQHIKDEQAIDTDKPFLSQRSFAHVSARYTKAVVATRPVKWGSGFHRVRGRNLHIDNNLFLFHFGMVDYELSVRKTKDQSLIDSGWEGHFGRRQELFDLIVNSEPVDGDKFFREARRRESMFRPFYAWNKPGMLKEKPIVRIPDRFRNIV